jgi:enamine deaminase RidA (YjgF/YER057c/UK114 family)
MMHRPSNPGERSTLEEATHLQDRRHVCHGYGGDARAAAQCYRLGNFVFMIGQTAFTLEGELVGVGDAVRQARQGLLEHQSADGNGGRLNG